MSSVKNLVVVGLRLYGLLVMFTSAGVLPSRIGMYFSFGGGDWFTKVANLSGMIFGVVYLVAGFLIWKYSIRIADVVMKGLPENLDFDPDISFEKNYRIAVSVLGLFILTVAVPSAIILAVSYIFPEANPKYVKTLNPDRTLSAQIPVVDYLRVVLELGIGAWLFCGSKGFVHGLKGIWIKGKTLGT